MAVSFTDPWLVQAKSIDLSNAVARVDGQGRDRILGPFDGCSTQSKLMHHGHSETVHQHARILDEALLAWNEVVAVVGPRPADGRPAGADLLRCRAGLLLP